jgi:hypothetical protein
MALRVTLTPIPHRLPEIVTSTTHLGIVGFVYADDGTPLPDAAVQLLGRGGGARSAGDGQFRLSTRAGGYTMRIDREGFATQLVSVRVAEQEGTTVLIWLRRAARNDPKEIMRRANLFDLQRSLLRTANPSLSVFNRHDVERVNRGDLRLAIQSLVAIPPSFDACAKLNGGPDWAPLFAIDPQDVELLITSTPRESRLSARASLRAQRMADGCAYAVWTR